ncbi:pantoate--beta-alanine ligase [Methylobacterium marchantiae]|uniref:Pantothenate synthetase n=1 Tax=Methylobacterium marchantiae TaxID=600331 RepID=A0ABW3WTX0_9HYPH|nr:Pantothenate synthetase [Methylobacterium marchantiae]
MSIQASSVVPLRFDAVAPLRACVSDWKASGDRVVLVPTMGALHQGHLSLVDRARELGRRVVVSIFVNPTQFGPSEDFSRYPRDTETDLALLAEIGVDAAYQPSVETMYPKDFSTSLTVAGITDGLCGAFRPGHFSGVATVVTKLVNQVQPDVALFGEKDFQQLQVIRRAVRDLDIPVEIGGVPTLREEDGLALSSRNRYLDAEERKVAPALHRELVRIAEGLRAGGAASTLVAASTDRLIEAGFGTIQYLSVCDAETLAPVEHATGPTRVLVAAYLGSTRLIDNVAV